MDARAITKRGWGSASGRHEDGESGDWEQWTLCDLSELLEDEVAEQTAPFPFPSFCLSAAGLGEEPHKNTKETAQGCGDRGERRRLVRAPERAEGAPRRVRSLEVGSRKGEYLTAQRNFIQASLCSHVQPCAVSFAFFVVLHTRRRAET